MRLVEVVQATFWQAQMKDGTIIRGGKDDSYAGARISAVDPAKLKMLEIAHNTYGDKYYAPYNRWYHCEEKCVVTTPTYPLQYSMLCGRIVVIDYDAMTGLLKLDEI